MRDKTPVLVAGIGGGSLGTEMGKALRDAGGYHVLGADISPYAYGHYDDTFDKTWTVELDGYVENIVELCRRQGITVVVPGGERPMVSLMHGEALLRAAGVRLAGNRSDLVLRLSDKRACFAALAKLGFAVPFTLALDRPLAQTDKVPFPCIIKPATDTGGSNGVTVAEDLDTANSHIQGLLKAKRTVVVQEYVSADEGEFTIGVLHVPGGRLVGSIALRRMFHAKLSVAAQGPGFLVSSGNSQGLIDHFPEVCRVAERMATALGSEGPLNVQARLRRGVLLPFEINPRFSASTYLRAMAGFNEIDLFLRSVLHGEVVEAPTIKSGYYLRSLTQTFVPLGSTKA